MSPSKDICKDPEEVKYASFWRIVFQREGIHCLKDKCIFEKVGKSQIQEQNEGTEEQAEF